METNISQDDTDIRWFPIGCTGECSLEIVGNVCFLYKDGGKKVYKCDLTRKSLEMIQENEMKEVCNKKLNIKQENENEKDGVVTKRLKEDYSIIDLDDQGLRWEGSSIGGKPFGFGCLYNDENRCIYQGFMIQGKKECYGLDFYTDCSSVEYCGNFLNGMRYGMGSLYDRKGNLLYKGMWTSNSIPYQSNLDIEQVSQIHEIHYLVEELRIGIVRTTDITDFILQKFHRLKSLTVLEGSFPSVCQVRISDCCSLEVILIESGCFNAHINWKDTFMDVILDHMTSLTSDTVNSTSDSYLTGLNDTFRHFCVQDCKSLRLLHIDSDSFADYAGSFVLESK